MWMYFWEYAYYRSVNPKRWTPVPLRPSLHVDLGDLFFTTSFAAKALLCGYGKAWSCIGWYWDHYHARRAVVTGDAGAENDQMNQQIQLSVVFLLMNDSETVSILVFHWKFFEFLKQLTKKGTNDIRQNSSWFTSIDIWGTLGVGTSKKLQSIL